MSSSLAWPILFAWTSDTSLIFTSKTTEKRISILRNRNPSRYLASSHQVLRDLNFTWHELASLPIPSTTDGFWQHLQITRPVGNFLIYYDVGSGTDYQAIRFDNVPPQGPENRFYSQFSNLTGIQKASPTPRIPLTAVNGVLSLVLITPNTIHGFLPFVPSF